MLVEFHAFVTSEQIVLLHQLTHIVQQSLKQAQDQATISYCLTTGNK